MMKKFRIRLLQKGPDPDPSKKDRIRRLKIDGIRHPAGLQGEDGWESYRQAGDGDGPAEAE